jgi:hypothetical protein
MLFLLSASVRSRGVPYMTAPASMKPRGIGGKSTPVAVSKSIASSSHDTPSAAREHVGGGQRSHSTHHSNAFPLVAPR